MRKKCSKVFAKQILFRKFVSELFAKGIDMGSSHVEKGNHITAFPLCFKNLVI